MMRKIRLWMLCLFLLVCCIGGTLRVSAANPGKVKLNCGRTYTKYDITGDGKADTIRIKMVNIDKWTYKKLFIYVNEKCVYSLSPDYLMFTPDICLYTLKNNKVFVELRVNSEDAREPVSGIFHYKNGKLIQDLDYSNFMRYGNHNLGYVTKVSGNQLNITLWSMTYAMGITKFNYTYVYKQNTLIRTSKIGTVAVTGYYKGPAAKWLTVKYDMKLYTGAASNHSAFTLKKGTKVRVTNCYIDGKNIRFKVRLKNGKSGWFNSPRRMISSGGVFEETYYA